MKKNYIVNLSEVGMEDVSSVGGKNASLGEMIQYLSGLGIRIPGGFVITVSAYEAFIELNGLKPEIEKILSAIDFTVIESLRRAGLQIRQLIQNGKFPEDFSNALVKAYSDLSATYGQPATDVAVRSSATAEDLPDASFAGQQDTYLNVRGPQSLMEAVRNCFASLFTDRAISYRQNFKFDLFDIGLSVCVQKMVRSDLASSGVAFSLDTESGFKDVVIINGSYGLGELIVQGSVSPDEFIVFKPTLEQGYSSIIEKKIGNKDKKMVYGDGADQRTKTISVEKSMQQRFCLSDEKVLELAGWVAKIETYYSQLKKTWCPMDVEWAVDGLTGELFIVQARPETIHSRRKQDTIVEYSIKKKAKNEEEVRPLLSGIAVGEKVGTGKVNILFSLDKREIEGNEFKEGDVLVTDMTDPDWEPIMKKASAIVTNKGGRTCHAAIVARELGVPAIVGCGNATEILQGGHVVTASCAEGEVGFIYEGQIPFVKNEFSVSDLPQTKTTVMLNVASPDMAFRFSQLPNKGVGLAREEFIINNYIKVHPMALLHHKTLEDKELTEQINKITWGYEDGEDFFVKRLSYGIARIAAAFYPNKVIVRFSDFKSNEYSNLLGGNYFEPTEENPMIGWRGASRYYSKSYKQAFGMECKAITRVREKMGLKNVAVMIPFCRTVDELLKVKGVMSDFGLEDREGPELFLMAELPSNIIMAKEFARHIDGFSIGTNDLTQLTLGLDRDSELVAPIYDERNEAVKRMIRMLITDAHDSGVKVGICGQAPSDYPEFAQFLVEEGIDSISVTPDSILKTVKAIHEIETKIYGPNSTIPVL